MAFKLHLGVRTSPGSYRRVTLNDVNCSTKIIDLKVEAGKITNLPMESLELSYCGNILDDEQTMFECNLQSGVTVHVLKKHVPNDFSKSIEVMTDAQITLLTEVFSVVILNGTWTSTLHDMIKRPFQIEKLIMICPALVDDPVAIAFLQDPVLMERLADLGTMKRMAQLHPALVELASQVIKAVDEKGNMIDNLRLPMNLRGSSRWASHLADLTDDEEMDSSQSSDSVAAPPSGHITSSQLAAALASATAGTFSPYGGSLPGPSEASAPAGQSSSSGSLVTPDRLHRALSRSFSLMPTPPFSSFGGPSEASTSAGQSSSSGSVITSDMLQRALARNYDLMAPPPVPPFPSSQGRNMALPQSQQIQQMHDLGLRDDVVNLHALSITGGDVQAAINLVLSGVITGDDDP